MKEIKQRRIHYVLALFFLAPLVAEFLFGNQPITALPWLLFIAPIYGGAAVLIREFTRRTGRSWPSIILLGAAFGLLLEGIIDQMIFNPAYLGLQNFDELAPIPAIGSSAYMIQTSLTLHAIWSITVPIVLIEAFDPTPRQPWLGSKGLVATVVLFVLGSALLTAEQIEKFHFMASPLQLGVVIAAIAVLCGSAWLIHHGRPVLKGKHKYGPRSVGIMAFLVLTFGYHAGSFFLANNAVWWFIFVAFSAALLWHWSHSRAWSDRHRLALAGGAVVSYICVSFVQGVLRGIPIFISIPGSIIFGVLAILLLRAALRQQKLHGTETESFTSKKAPLE